MRKLQDLTGISFTLGVVFATLLWGCVSAVFPYKYYGLNAMSYDGSLNGPTPADDLSLAKCMPTDQDKSPCVCMLTPEMLRLKADYKDKVNQIIALQQGCDQ